jgi:hypothetical protein
MTRAPKHPWVLVVETQHVVEKTTSRTRSYENRNDALAAADRINAQKRFATRAYVMKRS